MTNQKRRSLNREVALHFRDQLREARAVALKDAEAFEQLVFVVERIGMYITGVVGNLETYSRPVAEQARKSPLAEYIPAQQPDWHAPFTTLYNLVRHARNDALHVGVSARHLTSHAVDLTIILEDALMEEAFGARDFMVRHPVLAFRWQPISSVRGNMLANSFSFLPVKPEIEGATSWRLISDFLLSKYLRAAKSGNERKTRLARQLGEAIDAKEIVLIDAPTCSPGDSIETVLERSKGGLPVLVVASDGDLRGIVTPFDTL